MNSIYTHDNINLFIRHRRDAGCAIFLRQAPAPPALIMTSTTEGKAREAGRGVEKDSGELGNWEK